MKTRLTQYRGAQAPPFFFLGVMGFLVRWFENYSLTTVLPRFSFSFFFFTIIIITFASTFRVLAASTKLRNETSTTPAYLVIISIGITRVTRHARSIVARYISSKNLAYLKSTEHNYRAITGENILFYRVFCSTFVLNLIVCLCAYTRAALKKLHFLRKFPAKFSRSKWHS